MSPSGTEGRVKYWGSSAVGEGRWRVDSDRDHLPCSIQHQPGVERHSLSAYSRYPNVHGGKRRYTWLVVE